MISGRHISAVMFLVSKRRKINVKELIRIYLHDDMMKLDGAKYSYNKYKRNDQNIPRSPRLGQYVGLRLFDS